MADAEAVLVRQPGVQQDQVVLVYRRLKPGFFSVLCDVHGVALVPQALREHLRGGRLVFNDQDSHESLK